VFDYTHKLVPDGMGLPGQRLVEGADMRVPLADIKKKAAQMKSKGEWGRVLDPIPAAQTQEGPTCGFYALSIVMDYWKAKGRTTLSAPARQRDIYLQQRDPAEKDNPSLRKLGKQAGSLDVSGMINTSTGGVWTATQLAAVASAVKFANFKVRVETQPDPSEFILAIFRAIDADIPPIVAFDVRNAEPVPDAAGQRSHWGVILGYFLFENFHWLFATHGHGFYHVWPAVMLQQSNFALADTTYKKEFEQKVMGVGAGLTGKLAHYTRTQWLSATEIERFPAMMTERKLEGNLYKQWATREACEVKQDLARHIVLVEPAN
jgi:hypothetical protein